MKQLTEKGREQWLQADFDNLVDVQLYAPQQDQLWRRVKGTKILKRGQLAVLQQLAIWRESRAKDSNRPRKWILPDDVLVDIARRCPSTLEALEKNRGWSNYIKKYAQDILQIVAKAKAIPEALWPDAGRSKPLTVDQEALVDLLMSIVKIRARENDVTPAALITRKELENLVLGERNLEVLTGWRLALIGQELLDCLDGNKTVSVQHHKIVINDSELTK